MTPLHFAAYFGRSEVFNFLANNGDDLGAKTDAGFTALHLACLNGQLKVVKQYSNFTKKENSAKDDGKYPIHAVEKGFHEVIIFHFFRKTYLAYNNLAYLIIFSDFTTT